MKPLLYAMKSSQELFGAIVFGLLLVVILPFRAVLVAILFELVPFEQELRL